MNDSLPPSFAAEHRSDRAARLAGLLTTSFLAVLTWPMWRYVQSSGDVAPLVGHLLVLAYGLAVLRTRSLTFQGARDWLPLTLGPFLYIELRWTIAGIGLPHRDALVQHWESVLFPGNPSATLAPRFGSPLLSEALHLAYASYYLLVYVPLIVLYLKRERAAFTHTMLAMTLVYGACFITYALFPVDGPRYLVGPAHAPDGPIRTFVLALLDRGSSRGTAFPSSHVAASVVSALCALRHQYVLGLLVSLVAAALTVATVYGGFHYAVDGLIGVILGGLAFLASTALWATLPSRATHSATAAS